MSKKAEKIVYTLNFRCMICKKGFVSENAVLKHLGLAHQIPSPTSESIHYTTFVGQKRSKAQASQEPVFVPPFLSEGSGFSASSSPKNISADGVITTSKKLENSAVKTANKEGKRAVKKPKTNFSNSLGNMFSGHVVRMEKLDLWKSRKGSVQSNTQEDSSQIQTANSKNLNCDSNRQESDLNEEDGDGLNEEESDSKQQKLNRARIPHSKSINRSYGDPNTVQSGQVARNRVKMSRKKRRCADQNCIPCSVPQDCLSCHHCLNKQLK